MIWSGAERRKSVRVQIRVTVHVERSGQPRFYEGVTRDLSVSGSCLVLRQQLSYCTPIYLEFCLPGSLVTLYCPAHVAWANDSHTSLLGDGSSCCVLGVEFVRPPRAVRRELKRFVAMRLKSKP